MEKVIANNKSLKLQTESTEPCEIDLSLLSSNETNKNFSNSNQPKFSTFKNLTPLSPNAFDQSLYEKSSDKESVKSNESVFKKRNKCNKAKNKTNSRLKRIRLKVSDSDSDIEEIEENQRSVNSKKSSVK